MLGTEEEYLQAMEHLRDPKYSLSDVVVFFKAVDDQRMRDPGDQLQKVLISREAWRTIGF